MRNILWRATEEHEGGRCHFCEHGEIFAPTLWFQRDYILFADYVDRYLPHYIDDFGIGDQRGIAFVIVDLVVTAKRASNGTSAFQILAKFLRHFFVESAEG